MRIASLGLAIGSVALLGFGCKSPQEKLEARIRAQQQVVSDALSPSAQAWTPDRDPNRVITNEPNPSPDILFLRQVMANLGKAETFRSVVEVPVNNGNANIAIDFNKSIGMFGRMRSSLKMS